MIKLHDALSSLGGIISFGFGDSILIGAIFGMIEDTPPDEMYDNIVGNKDISSDISNDDWSEMRKLLLDINLDEINTQRIINDLHEKRLDLLSVIINTPGGIEWVDNQIATFKRRLHD